MKPKDFLFLLLITLASVLIHGYYFDVLDHHHYLPYLNKLLNPALYPNDYYFNQPHYLYSPFNYVIVWLKTISGASLAWVFLGLYLVSLYLLYLGIYWLAFTIYRSRSIALLAAVLFIAPKWLARIGYLSHHFYFISRDLSLAVSLLALTSMLRRKSWSSLGLILLAALINPTIPIPLAIFWLALFFKPSGNRFFSFLPSINQAWFDILESRGTYSFPHLWPWTAWGNFALWLALLGTALLALKKKIFGLYFKPIKLLLVICSGLFLFHLIISSLLPSPQLIQLQLLRAASFVFIVALISFAAAAYFCLMASSWPVRILTGVALTGVYFWGMHLTLWHFLAIGLLPLGLFIFKPKLNLKSKKDISAHILILVLTQVLFVLVLVKPQVKLPDYFHYPNPLVDLKGRDDWLDVQVWAKVNSPVEAVFLAPPEIPGFRSFSERNLVSSAKDGGLIFYSAQYAIDWQQRRQALKGYDNFTSADFLAVKNLYSFDYLVVKVNHQPLDFNLVYFNPGFKVYKL